MTELSRRPWSLYGVLAGIVINVPDLAFALTALAWDDSTTRASALSASLGHGVLVLGVVCLMFEPTARTIAIFWASTEVLKTLGFHLQSGGSLELGTAVVLLGALLQARAAASAAMFTRSAPRRDPEPAAGLGYRIPQHERSARPPTRAM